MKKFILAALAALLAWNIYLTVKINEVNTSENGSVVIRNNVDGEINDVTALVDTLKEYIVSIESNSKTYSGFVVEKEDDKIYILTTYAASENPTVIFDSGARLQGSVIASDVGSQLALVCVDADFEVMGVTFAQETTSIGENIIAISGRDMSRGNMILSMGFSSDAGLDVLSEESSYYSNVYISDMNVGSNQYGSAVVNLNGELVGMVVYQDEDHLTYILSSDEIQKAYKEMKENAIVERGILDVVVRPIRDMESYEKNENGFDLDTTEGMFVSKVGSNSCAYGILKHGDRIIEIDDKEINSYEDFMDVQYKNKSGDVVEIMYESDGVEQTSKVTLK